ncbi:MAG TPA: ribonuclease Y [Thermomicrobiales bacterium]|jgi:ribonuclease Y|nr:ribonuclease Y [Chloroflexota bacterium]HBY47205.1 ribonuclease Y [Chloroflexota bacterium]HCG30102.1 ribonuclease Y [Chloroflexota bacterium]HQX63713.1 ribonuclease Y [Thermomicrobiales bacterium]
MEYVLIALASAVLGGAIAALLTRAHLQSSASSMVGKANLEAQRITEEAEAQRRETVLEAKDEAIRIRNEMDREVANRRRDTERMERRIEQKEEQFDRKTEQVDRRDRNLERREKELDQREGELKTFQDRQEEELQRVAMMTTDQAREVLLRQTEDDMRDILNRRVHELEQEAKAEADRRSRKILATTIQRIASDYIAESTVSVVPLPSDDMKGRIIGREGRNIRALEQATGCDLIVDDTPEAVTLSGFDPVRREIARRALLKLIQDGRIHPARIEEVVNKTRLDLEQVMREEGEKVAYEANVQGLHPDLIKLLGRLKYRTSYGQNVLAHSLEVSLVAGALAAELGADVNVSKTAGLLHDIGKAVDHEVDGPHALIGADIARRLGRSARIVHAIAAHHGEEEPQTVEAFIVATADGISGARPGARREMVETYIKRLEALEAVANSFDGVEKCFAIQAGREVRIMVQPEKVDDLAAAKLARDIVKKIEENLEYPGQIKVTVIRETRAVDYAR